MSKPLVTALAAGLACASAPGQTFIVLNTDSPTLDRAVALSANGLRGAAPFRLWQSPANLTPFGAAFHPGNSSPDGQFAVGSETDPDTLLPIPARMNGDTLAVLPLALPPGLNSGAAHASSEDNLTHIGTATDGANEFGVRWTSDGPAAIPPPPGFTGTRLDDLSADGAVACGQLWQSGVGTAMRWTLAGGAQPMLGTALEPLVGHVPRAIAADGRSIVGLILSLLRAFRWTSDGVTQMLVATPELGEATMATAAYDVSGDGLRTGGIAWQTSAPTASPEAMLWNATGVADRLADALTRAGCTDHHAYRLISVASVSADGRTVSGVCEFSPWFAKKVNYAVFVATLPPVCPADIGKQGGILGPDGNLDNNDFVSFIDLYFVGDLRADFGVQGGIAGRDGLLNNNDFVMFLEYFFDGCPN